jgi:CRP-like cAMP-binding protein
MAAVAPSAPRIERFTPGDGVDFQPPVVGGTPFTELESGAESLLHAVELAALAGAGQHPAPAPSEQTSDENVTEPPVQEGALPSIPLFSDLPRDAFIALFERCPLRRFPEGARIIEQGTRGNAFYVICEGRVRIVRQTGAEQRELAVMGEGAFFGEMALLSGAPRSASVVSASEETQVLEISAPVLAELSRNFPQVAKALRRFCRQRLLSDVVNTSALFQPFGRKDRRELVERFRAREVRRGEVLIQEGQQVDGLYVVLSGEVAVSKGGQSLAVLREGDLFGEMSLLQKTPATATVTAARNTSLMRLPREDFDTLILTHPQILALVSELTETRQRHTVELLLGERMKSREPAGSLEELILF